jgi:hypothetical protein
MRRDRQRREANGPTHRNKTHSLTHTHNLSLSLKRIRNWTWIFCFWVLRMLMRVLAPTHKKKKTVARQFTTHRQHSLLHMRQHSLLTEELRMLLRVLAPTHAGFVDKRSYLCRRIRFITYKCLYMYTHTCVCWRALTRNRWMVSFAP